MVDFRAVHGTYAYSGHFDAHVEHLALGLRVGVVPAEDLVPAAEARLGHVVQAVAGPGRKLAARARDGGQC